MKKWWKIIKNQYPIFFEAKIFFWQNVHKMLCMCVKTRLNTFCDVCKHFWSYNRIFKKSNFEVKTVEGGRRPDPRHYSVFVYTRCWTCNKNTYVSTSRRNNMLICVHIGQKNANKHIAMHSCVYIRMYRRYLN